MTLFHAVRIIDYFGTVRDFSPVVDTDATVIPKPNWSRSVTGTLVLRMYVRDYLAGTYNVSTMDEVWAGFVDDDGNWQDQDLFGGYVRRWSVKKRGGMIIMQILCDSYDVLWKKIIVPGYPDNPFNPAGGGRSFHVPPSVLAGDAPLYGVPGGYSCLDWLVGDNFATGWSGEHIDGVVRRFLPGIDFGGIDTIFGTAGYFGVDARPTNSTVRGYVELLYLGDVVDLIMTQFRLLHPLTRPGYFLKPIADPADLTRVTARFRAADLAAAETADWFFSDDAADLADGAFRYQDYEYTSDGADYFDYIAVAGAGAISAGFDTTHHQELIQRVWGVNDDRANSKPNRFAITGRGWQLLHRDNDVTTQAQATNLANALAEIAHLDRVSNKLTAWQPVQAGEIIRVKHRATQGTASTGVNFQVQDVTPITRQGRRAYQVEAGWAVPTQDDIAKGPIGRLLELESQGLSPNPEHGAGPNFVPNSPAMRALYGVATNATQNTLQSWNDRAPSTRRLAATNRLKITPEGMLIDNTSDNFDGAPLADMPQRPDPSGSTLYSSPNDYALGADGTVTQYADADGVDGVQHHVLNWANGDGWKWIVITDPTLLTTVMVISDADESGRTLGWIDGNDTIGYTAQGSLSTASPTLTLKLRDPGIDPTVADNMIAVTPAVDSQHPLLLNLTDNLQLHLASTQGGHVYGILVSSRRPPVSLFKASGP